MGEVVNNGQENNAEVRVQDSAAAEIMEVAEAMLVEVRQQMLEKPTTTVPLSELLTMGGGLSSMKGQMQEITQEFSVNMKGLYKTTNVNAGEILKTNKAGDIYGSVKTAEGKSKFVKWQEAGPIKGEMVQKVKTPPNPAMMMMAASLYSIEQQLGRIEEMQEKMLLFLQIEKEAEIEADMETLTNMLRMYKLNWDNEQFVFSNYKLVLDIKRTALKNMKFYRKQVEEAVRNKKLFVAQSNVKEALEDFQKKFQYYQLSLHIYSMASMLEIMLSGNYAEANIEGIVGELSKLSAEYRENFDKGSAHIEKLGDAAVETTVMKGVGHAGKAVGKFIGAIPLVNKGPVDEFLQDKGAHLKENAAKKEKSAVHAFAVLSNPSNSVFTEKLKDMCKIYNHTDAIYFDHENIYLVGDESV